MSNKDFKMLSGLDLAMMEFPEGKFIVQDLIPKGLVILSCELMETGRSLAMDMSMRVVRGEKLWKMDTRQGAVLYMIHHHALATARNLIMDMSVRIPDDLYVGVMTDNDLDLALTGVKAFVQDHSNAAMVVIELNTPVEQYEDAVYVSADMVLQFQALKEAAAEHGIAIVVILSSECFPPVHRKAEEADMVCITEKADGHIDMCVLDGENTKTLIRVDVPPMAPRLWSIAFNAKRQHWVEENASDRP